MRVVAGPILGVEGIINGETRVVISIASIVQIDRDLLEQIEAIGPDDLLTNSGEASNELVQRSFCGIRPTTAILPPMTTRLR
jgi:hypothetical protein